MQSQQPWRGFFPAVKAGRHDGEARQRNGDNADRAAVALDERAAEHRPNANGQPECSAYETKASGDFTSLCVVCPVRSRGPNGVHRQRIKLHVEKAHHYLHRLGTSMDGSTTQETVL